MSRSSGSSSRKRGRPSSKSGATNPLKPPFFKSSPFSDFGSYMTEKNRKFRDQFETDASSSSHGANLAITDGGVSGVDSQGIFKGVAIFVDGFTVPPSQELKNYMLKHGGKFVNYFSRHTVTHIICSNLPDSKRKNLRAFSHGLPVVKPDWIADSIAANTLLSWVPYQLVEYAVTETSKQLKLSAFFSEKGISRSHHQGILIQNETSLSDKCKGESTELTPSGTDNFSQENSQESKHIDTNDELKDVKSESEEDCSTSYVAGKSSDHLNRPHSTLTDPNFVENYFKYSRLHFIGTWRNRYRKRFSNFLSGTGSKNNNPNNDTENLRRIVIHIDMDCFFVSVVIRIFPDLLDKPVAVCHSNNPKGTAEISSANYPARSYGIKAGMFVRDAKARCPHLIIFPYDFSAYEEVADQFYSILHKHCKKVQAVSCDEAFLAVSLSLNDNPENIAEIIRKEIFETTRCTASAGIGENMLLARLATKSAKPNGQCFIPLDKVNEYLDKLPISALPGVGYNVEEKLRMKEVETCGQLRTISKDVLQKDLGSKMGDMLWNYCRGIDHSAVEAVQETKSIGAEVNWGVRFKDSKDSENFLMNLCKEVSLRLHGCGVQGRTITLKVKVRKKGAGEPVKYMGCGDCETISRSLTVPGAINDVDSLHRIAKQTFASFHLDVKEVRGVGLKLSRLELANPSRKGIEESRLELLFSSATRKGKQPVEQSCSTNHSREDAPSGACPSSSSAVSQGSNISELPPLSHIDLDVVRNLPPEIFLEMNGLYKGELRKILESQQQEKEYNSESVERKDCRQQDQEISTRMQRVLEPSEASCSKSNYCKSDLMPGSLSQVDFSILENLPDEVRTDILKQLPPHRVENQFSESSKSNLSLGSHSKGFEMLRVQNCLLSEFLLSNATFLTPNINPSSEEWDAIVVNSCEFMKEYIRQKIESDIEELYNCFRLLKRLSSKSSLLLELYDRTLPLLQASIGEHYGGKIASLV
ncbi:DNA repair protein REV1 [Rhynchospora pubera]|uniref:DNA repair protein REV1 n=1 Tax=Rhynchospora pubera TaxID=906938 RepID=A0AAV8G050_9POAL|nr:DNA repair protein REV1 [Rhynchospora pubera]